MRLGFKALNGGVESPHEVDGWGSKPSAVGLKALTGMERHIFFFFLNWLATVAGAVGPWLGAGGGM